MSEIEDLYQELLLDHYRRPRNRGDLKVLSSHADGHNPLCGDRVSVSVLVENGILKDIAFQGIGCAISTASASLMTEMLKGKPVEEARALFKRFLGLVTGDESPDADLGKLEIFSGVCNYPSRVKCATLAWRTFEAALNNNGQTVTSE